MGLCADEDHAGGQLDPAEGTSCAATRASGDPPKLRQGGVSALHGTADAALPRPPGLPALGCFRAEAGGSRPLAGGAITVSAVGAGARQVSGVGG